MLYKDTPDDIYKYHALQPPPDSPTGGIGEVATGAGSARLRVVRKERISSSKKGILSARAEQKRGTQSLA